MLKTVNFQGLSCYQNSMISIADEMCVRYDAAFSNLWSDYDFLYDDKTQVYTSDRMVQNLALLGCKRRVILPVESDDAESCLAELAVGRSVIVGIDSYRIPWSDSFEIKHTAHYFAAQKTDSDDFVCFDPTYQKSGMRLTAENLITAFELTVLLPVKPDDLKAARAFDLKTECGNVVESIPRVKRNLLSFIENIENGTFERGLRAAKYVDLLVGNRLLFRHYLQGLTLDQTVKKAVMPPDYFLVWSAVKNGLYKISVARNAKGVDKIKEFFTRLLDNDLIFANRILTAITEPSESVL